MPLNGEIEDDVATAIRDMTELETHGKAWSIETLLREEPLADPRVLTRWWHILLNVCDTPRAVHLHADYC